MTALQARRCFWNWRAHLQGRKHDLTYWLVFFDGEEAVREQWTDTDSIYGSRHLVQKLSSDGELGRVQAMILVDMIGDASLDIHREAQFHAVADGSGVQRRPPPRVRKGIPGFAQRRRATITFLS